MGDLSFHFSRQELACRCCGRLQIEKRLIGAPEDLRSRAGVRIVIHAGYRCPAHNLEVGGVPDSEHTRGLAGDIHVPGLTQQAMYELVSQVPLFAAGGIGAYDRIFYTSTCGDIVRAGHGCAGSTSALKSWYKSQKRGWHRLR